MSKGSPFASVQILRSTSRSVGDAMRDLDKREILQNDFIVLYGDMISNLPLAPALAAHKKRRAEDKNCIMTMVLRQSHANEHNSHFDTPVFICDPRKNRCLYYETMRSHSDERFLMLDSEILNEPEIEIRADLLDCGIDICTPGFLALWSDNFDFQTPRENFLYSVLKDYELNGKTIFTHIVDDHYVKRVENLRQYATITKDVIGRWTYPLCPDTNLLQFQNYQLNRNHVYLDENLQLARSCIIKAKSVIGANCKIGRNTVISNSVIGPSCKIGDNVVVENSFIWTHATIGSRSIIKQAIVADYAQIGDSCILEPGALVSFDVVIDNGITVKGSSRITRMRHKFNSTNEIEQAKVDPTVVGTNGVGSEYVPDEDDETDQEHDAFNNSLAPNLLYILSSLSISQESVSVFSDDETDTSSTRGPIATSTRDRSTASSFLSTGSVVDDDDDPESAAAAARVAHDFHHEASNSLLEALQRNSPPSTVLLELNGLRLSTNASPHSVRRAVAHAFAKQLATMVNNGHAAKAAVNSTVSPHVDMWRRIVFDHDAKDKADQVDLLLCIQTELKAKNEGETILFFLLQELVNLDVIEAEGVEQWWESEKSVSTEEMKAVRSKSKALVDFLLADDDEDDDEEDSDEEE
jgi:translation initiation factor eIF-2B subunit epsilon